MGTKYRIAETAGGLFYVETKNNWASWVWGSPKWYRDSRFTCYSTLKDAWIAVENVDRFPKYHYPKKSDIFIY